MNPDGFPKAAKVQQFEKEFAAFARTDYAVCYNDGWHDWHVYVLQVDEKQAGVTQNELNTALKDEYNIGTSVHIIPVHIHPYDQKQFGFKETDYPRAMNNYKRTLSPRCIHQCSTKMPTA